METSFVSCAMPEHGGFQQRIVNRFPISIDKDTTIDSQVELEIDGPLAMKLVVEELELEEETHTVELSLLLCNDPYIQKLNKVWLHKDSPTDVLSFPQDQAAGMTPILLLGDAIISLETAAKRAEERGHSLLDELRILLDMTMSLTQKITKRWEEKKL